ncbi:PEP-CTERM sorting domain-containing protein [Cyanothece sp. BG0011]|uniref:PEP-CTERM sorting domain-containing protein n=1 Tax=Cyanothece sp. BG0011 TaxID=2082950 RepID=UPI000D1F3CDD|nr:PEP-CTERM sorting domain-containing protein [Cyanothece sp. BG0011]
MKLKPLASGLAASVVVSVVGLADAANAATFNFSFSNVEGNTTGTVEGTLELPDGDFSGQAATSVIVTSAPAALGYTTPFDIIPSVVTPVANSFTVVGGEIDVAASQLALVFNVGTLSTSVFSLSFPGFGSLLGVNGNPATDGNNGVVDVNDTTLVFSNADAVSTPEPTSTLMLVGVGLFGMATKLKKKA